MKGVMDDLYVKAASSYFSSYRLQSSRSTNLAKWLILILRYHPYPLLSLPCKLTIHTGGPIPSIQPTEGQSFQNKHSHEMLSRMFIQSWRLGSSSTSPEFITWLGLVRRYFGEISRMIWSWSVPSLSYQKGYDTNTEYIHKFITKIPLFCWIHKMVEEKCLLIL